MGVSAPAFSTLQEDDAIGAPDSREWANRVRLTRQRRNLLDLIALSYLVDAGLLLVYGLAGIISPTTSLAFVACGLTVVAIYQVMLRAGICAGWPEHLWVIPQMIIHLAVLITFAWLTPQVGVVFMCTVFVMCSFAALRATLREALIDWGLIALAVGALFLLLDRPLALPQDSTFERLMAVAVLILAFGRCLYLGTLSAALREKLYRRSVELKQAYDKIEELAELDELTGALNRRSIMRSLEDQIAAAERNGEPMSIALIDLDWFKRINDVFGHPTGDEVLKTFSISIFANIRAVDRFGRYGGEEFLLILPQTALPDAAFMLERLRVIVADLDWSAFSDGMQVTLSAGLATLAADETPEALLARADAALYQAKELGRNRVALANSAMADVVEAVACPSPYVRIEA
jgi:diguanylate cyclase (GGDEF)-like protein